MKLWQPKTNQDRIREGIDILNTQISELEKKIKIAKRDGLTARAREFQEQISQIETRRISLLNASYYC